MRFWNVTMESGTFEGRKEPLNDLTVARGHGYNSEAREAWSGEQLALREQLPDLFRPGELCPVL